MKEKLIFFSEAVSKLPAHEMTPELFKMYGELFSTKNAITIQMLADEEELPWVVKAMVKRLPIYSYTIDAGLLIFIAALSEAIGYAVMYLNYLEWWCTTHDATEVTFEVFGLNIFPHGFPSKEAMRELSHKYLD